MDGKANSGHTHDDRYFTESEINTKLNEKATKYTSKGSSTQPVYIDSSGVPTAISYTIAKSVPSNAVFTDTNTWRGIQNNLSSTSTTDSLSAYQGKVLNDYIDRIGHWGHASSAGITTTFYNSCKGDTNFVWLSKNQNTGMFMIVIDGIFNNINFKANTAYKIFNLKCNRNDFGVYHASFMLAQTNAWADTIFSIYHNGNVMASQDFYVRPSTDCWLIAGALVLFGYIF